MHRARQREDGEGAAPTLQRSLAEVPRGEAGGADPASDGAVDSGTGVCNASHDGEEFVDKEVGVDTRVGVKTNHSESVVMK